MSMFDELLSNDLKKDNKIFGVMSGLVTDNNDPDKKNRVKVQLFSKINDKTETGFIPVAMPMVGKEFGIFFMPEIGDEVLVAFENGDIEKGYVIGGLYNDTKKAPVTVEEGKNDVKKIKTRTNNEMTLSDKENEQFIEIKTEKGYKVLIDDSKDQLTIQDKEGKNKVAFSMANGQIEVEAEKKIVLKAGQSSIILSDGKIEIEASNSIRLKAAQVMVEASSSASVSSSGMMEVKSDKVVNIKGATVKIN
ncbi:MAG: DUF2345 domain-containing protein [Clostridia bacterium]|nr:DUF2345 domain-containing protein [Clostridia bacterium]